MSKLVISGILCRSYITVDCLPPNSVPLKLVLNVSHSHSFFLLENIAEVSA